MLNWMVVFVPSAMAFAVSVVYLVAGVTVAYAAPVRHGCLKVVENYSASRRGGVRCLSVLNDVFAITFGLLALFLSSTPLTLGSSCSYPYFSAMKSHHGVWSFYTEELPTSLKEKQQ